MAQRKQELEAMPDILRGSEAYSIAGKVDWETPYGKKVTERAEKYANSKLGSEHLALTQKLKRANQYVEYVLSEKTRDTLVHEIQHAIQNREGFASGASPEYFADKIKLSPEMESATKQII